MSLITRLYECTSGKIEINGININDYNIQSLRRSIGIVQQEPVLFNGTIFENIALGDPKITIKNVEEACKIANAHDFVIRLQNVRY